MAPQAAWLLVLLGVSVAVAGRIRVLEPPELAEQFPDGIEGSTAAFAPPSQYGELHCRDRDYEVPAPHTMLPNIVMVRRGLCNFVTKVRVAEVFKNAKAVIVADTEGAIRTPTEIQRVIMADDGWGETVRSPSILISDMHAQKIIDVLSPPVNKTVLVELVWDMPLYADTVRMDLWVTPALDKSVRFLQGFAKRARQLRHTSCALPPERKSPAMSTGRDVIDESLRQMCLWDKTYTEGTAGVGGYSEVWWTYVEEFPKRCMSDTTKDTHQLNGTANAFGAACSFELMAELGADVDTVQKCINMGSEELLNLQLRTHAWSPTAMRISDMRYAGPPDPEIVVKAICSEFPARPLECSRIEMEQLQHTLDMLASEGARPARIDGNVFG
ncbi:unnamed protein product [Vitrella brassicaformis CCMP3155]|uniref:PA domain-containing protein n=1 Tax=Vitrella brassicaformis (strain CCMP3155) TaxID=1169540 RepID=A0A0G4H6I1_VITBC|nr:unnamed protein product [Vitrella brassicaformis CCMP3155]|eukprot:CEM39469.1 unnamed protein product [Vitrella brassicaformis CCMP3155]